MSTTRVVYGLILTFLVVWFSAYYNRSNEHRGEPEGHERTAQEESWHRLAHGFSVSRGSCIDPPLNIHDEDGTPFHSWRMQITNLIDQNLFVGSYDLTVKWNQGKNQRFLKWNSEAALAKDVHRAIPSFQVGGT